MKDIQGRVQSILESMVHEGRERGIQAAVYYRGELIVDAWAGVADHQTGKPVNGSTLFPLFSTTKGIAATIIHLLAERGKLQYDMEIRELWPEFGVNGKEHATIRQALNHTLGIPYMPEGLGLKEVVDWDTMCSEIARLTPVWTPGEHMLYHAMTFGWVVGEIAQRADGRKFSEIMNDEICKPLGITDLYAGIPDEVEPRIAILEEPEYEMPSGQPEGPQMIPPSLLPLHVWMNRADARRACIPATTGIMTAKAIARHYAALLPGGVDGVELLPPSRIKLATEQQKPRDGALTAMTLGYFTGTKDAVMGSRPSVFGHGGYGGSAAFGDPENHLAVGIAHNRLSNNGGAATIVKEIKEMLGLPPN